MATMARPTAADVAKPAASNRLNETALPIPVLLVAGHTRPQSPRRGLSAWGEIVERVQHLSGMTGDAIESRFTLVIRGISKPLLVDFISNNEEAWGIVVPIPAAPVEGKVLVCAATLRKDMHRIRNITG